MRVPSARPERDGARWGRKKSQQTFTCDANVFPCYTYLMERNKLIWIGMTLGSFIGGYLPVIWGGSAFSMSSVILTAVGGFTGIWLGLKLGQ